MQYSLVLAALVAAATAQYQSYGAPVQPAPPVGGYEQQQPEAYTPKVFKHIYIHVAPDEPADIQNRVIRVPGGDKHINIVFVRTPSQNSNSQTEVILPEQDEHKNLVYVLLKKGENSNDVRIRKPAAQPQQKPEVYFIRYKGQEQGGYAPAAPPAVIGPGPQAPQPVVRTPSSSYGTPF